jgi:predicted DNA-binding transcriptional regulator AlpA
MSLPPAPALAVEPIYSWRDVRPLLGGIGRTTAWRMIRAGTLPGPVAISPGRVGWRHSDIAGWQAERAGTAALHAKYGV